MPQRTGELCEQTKTKAEGCHPVDVFDVFWVGSGVADSNGARTMGPLPRKARGGLILEKNLGSG